MGAGGWSRAVSAALAIGLCSVASAQEVAPAPTPAQIAAWADQLLNRRLGAGDAPGMVVAIVLNGEVIHLKGYGFADTDRRVAMDASRTLVRIGAVSELATAATALAAAETGMVRLVQDVHPIWARGELSVAGPNTVTLQDLLTHTAGFGERLLGQFAPTEDQWEPLKAYLGRAMPPSVFQTGKAILPTAHGVALAGLTLELAAGQPFQDLARRLVFAPAGMDASTFEPRLGPPVRAPLATGHRWTGADALEPVSYDYARTFPAVGQLTTAADMAKLVQVVLAGGVAPGGARLWSEEANRTLLSRRVTNITGTPGRSYALYETPLRGRTSWVSDGLANGFTANLTLVPELGLGVFIAANGGTFQGLEDLSPTGALVRQFSIDLVGAHWAAVPQPPVATRNIAPDDRSDYGGQYRVATIDIDTPLKMLRVFSSVRVEDQSDVRIVVEGTVYQKIGLDLFQNGANLIRFLRDGDGNVTHLLRPNEIVDRAPFFERTDVQRVFMLFTLALFALGAVVSLLGLLGWRGKLANLIGLVAAGGGLALIGWIAWQLNSLSLGLALVYGIPGVPFAPALWIAPAAAAFISFFYALFGIGIPNVNRYTLIGTALAWGAFYPVLRVWNFLG